MLVSTAYNQTRYNTSVKCFSAFSLSQIPLLSSAMLITKSHIDLGSHFVCMIMNYKWHNEWWLFILLLKQQQQQQQCKQSIPSFIHGLRSSEFREFVSTSNIFGLSGSSWSSLNAKCRVKTQSASRISFVSNLATIHIHRHTYKVRKKKCP